MQEDVENKCPYKRLGKDFYCSYYNRPTNSECQPYSVIEISYTKDGEIDKFNINFYCSETNELIIKK